MTCFKQYFRAHLKSELRAITCILVSVLVLTFLIGFNAQLTWRYDSNFGRVPDYNSTLYIPVVVISILAYVLPVMEFSFFKKRINLDCAYSLPISRRTMGAVHYLTGFIILSGTFTASYLTNFALLISRGPGWFDFTPMIAHYFLSLLFGFVMYSMMVFVFNEANTRGDGIWFMILYTFIFPIVVYAIDEIIDSNSLLVSSYAMPFSTISVVTTTYENMVEMNDFTYKSYFWEKSAFIGWLIFWLVIGVATTVAFFLTFGKRRMEKTEEISDSFLGFRTIIPIYAISAMIAFNVSSSVILWVIIELLTLIGYTIYRRGFHYKKSDIAILCMLLIFLFK